MKEFPPTQKDQSAPPARVFGLDLMRAFAISGVLYQHSYTFIMNEVPSHLYFFCWIDPVTVFFVLSGFLIGRILLKQIQRPDFSAHTLLGFWIRRWFRTLPNYILVLVLIVFTVWMRGLPQAPELPLYFIFSQNLTGPHPIFFGEAWSISVEEWFYLGTPVLLYLFSQWRGMDRRRLIVCWITLTIILVTTFRIYRVVRYGYATELDWDLWLRKQVATRMDSIMFGVLGAYLSLFHAEGWQKRAGSAFAGGMALVILDRWLYWVGPPNFYANYLHLTVSALGPMLLLPLLSSWKRGPVGIERFITFLSLISYSMYLINFTLIREQLMPWVGSVLDPGKAKESFLLYAVFWLLTIGASAALYRFYERPMTDLRDRWSGA